MNKLDSLILGFAILLFSGLSSAQDGEKSGQAKGIIKLTLTDCLKMASRDNLTLRMTALNVAKANAEVTAASGLFEPAFFCSPYYRDGKVAPRSDFQVGSDYKAYGFRTGFQGKVLTGATYELSFEHSYYRSDTLGFTPSGGFGVAPNPLWTSIFALRLSQPLLKGAWKDRNTAYQRQAALGVKEADSSQSDLTQEMLLNVVKAYWNVVFAKENYKVRKISLNVAKKQLEITNKRIEASLAAEIDRIAAQSGVALARQNLIGAESLLYTAEDGLKSLILPFSNNTEWKTRIETITPFEDKLSFPIPDPADAAQRALTMRQDIKSAKLKLQSAKIALKSLDRDILPQLDLKGGYSTEDVSRHTTGRIDHLVDGRYPGWSIELAFSYPFGNSYATGSLKKMEFQVEQATRSVRIKEVEIWRQVRKAVRDLKSLKQEIEAGRKSVQLAESNLNNEEEKFRVGKTISFEVQRRNEALAAARIRYIRSVLDFRTGIAALHRAMGQLEPITVGESL